MAKIKKITMFAEPCEVANQMEADFEENSNNLKIMTEIVKKKIRKKILVIISGFFDLI